MRVGPQTRFDVDVKATGYDPAVADAITVAGIAPRTLVSTMHPESLRALRAGEADAVMAHWGVVPRGWCRQSTTTAPSSSSGRLTTRVGFRY